MLQVYSVSPLLAQKTEVAGAWSGEGDRGSRDSPLY